MSTPLDHVQCQRGTVTAHVTTVAHAGSVQTHPPAVAVVVIVARATSVDVVSAGRSYQDVLVQSHLAIGAQPVAVTHALVFNAESLSVALAVLGAIPPTPLHVTNVHTVGAPID